MISCSQMMMNLQMPSRDRFIPNRLFIRIRRWARCLFFSSIVLLLFSYNPSFALAGKVSILEIDINSYQVAKAMGRLDLPKAIETRFFTISDLTDNPSAKAFLADSKIIFVNVMHPELANYPVDAGLMDGRYVYALNPAGDPEALGKKGYRFDDEVMAYYRHRSVTNMVNMVRMVVARHMDPSLPYGSLEKTPEVCIHHPDAKQLFTRPSDYWQWNAKRDGFDPDQPRVGILCYSAMLKEGQVEAADDLIRQLEAAGFAVLPCFGSARKIISTFLRPENGRSPVDMVLAFSLKFSSAIDDELRKSLVELDAPVFDVIRPFGETIDEWKKSEVGLGPMETVWAVATPEFSGSIEPSVIMGKKRVVDPVTGRPLFIYETIQETVGFLIPRLKKWAQLQKMANGDKKVAIFYYNHSQGKQNIAAAYLNVFRSLESILGRLVAEGYTVDTTVRLTEERLQKMVLAGGRNIGSWAPGELDAMMAEGEVETVDLATYKAWFDQLPEAFTKPVLAQWGPPEDCAIMTRDNRMVFPMVKLGSIVILPEPARGWTDDPMKLYHDKTLFPHHQYIAAYLWLSRVFHADAMIHLGTHATYEWLPGKQVGLAPWDPPEIMTGAIPNIYPYIVDDVGEGIQAKRRGRGVVIDHLTPPMKKADLYHEYAKLHDLYHKYEISVANGSETASAYMEKVQALVREMGIANDLGLDRLDEEAMEKVHLYLHEIDNNSLPYGLHTFGRAYDEAAASETVDLIIEQNPDADPENVKADLSRSAKDEMDNLIRGLNGRYVPAGEGNDPLRNLAALPTGRNFYGFSPAKVPSKAAWTIGKRAAEQMIQEKLAKTGDYPQKVGIVLWATETTRNEGVNESTILYLMGIEPVWDATERVTGSRVIPGAVLRRPRIDVLINPSGLYRDMFPDKLVFLDEAVEKAMAQTDIENLLAKHNAAIEKRLMDAGMDEAEAKSQSRFRIFTEQVGSYGNGVAEMASASGLWEEDDAVSDVYLNRVQFAVGQGKWGVPVRAAFTENLRDVDVAVHSRSTNVIGIIDTDDFFMYLGGMSLAVKNLSGKAPDTMVTLHRRKDEIRVEDVEKTIGREMRTRYLNPQWIEGMKKDNYGGARQMADFAENLWGWQVTVPTAVDADKWEQVYEVYVKDKYDQDLAAFFDKHNPWAYQSMTARMLETVRKGYWQADDEIRQKLAVEYAVNVVEKGVACCDHTCNNPMLNQMVVNIISLPGVMSPEMVEKFKLAIEKMAARSLEDQAKMRRELLEKLKAAPGQKESANDPPKAEDADRASQDVGAADAEQVEGYKMEDIDTNDTSTDLTSSGVQWIASLFVIFVIGAFVWGTKRK